MGRRRVDRGIDAVFPELFLQLHVMNATLLCELKQRLTPTACVNIWRVSDLGGIRLQGEKREICSRSEKLLDRLQWGAMR